MSKTGKKPGKESKDSSQLGNKKGKIRI